MGIWAELDAREKLLAGKDVAGKVPVACYDTGGEMVELVGDLADYCRWVGKGFCNVISLGSG